VNLDQTIAQFGKDLEWFSFYARYCAGKNIEKPFCRDFEWWALGIAVLVAVIVIWWIWGRLSRVYRDWAHRRMLAKVADAETMNKYRWSGPDLPNAKPSSEQRAGRSEKR